MRAAAAPTKPPPVRFVTLAKIACRVSGRAFRPYQVHAAWEVLQTFSRSGVVLQLPQGTGKTFVSQLVLHGYLKARPGSKILVVAPTKELREQYCRMGMWLGRVVPRISVLNFRSPIADYKKQCSWMVAHSDVVVTTPEQFSNRLDWFDEDLHFSLCILDEIDLWSIDDHEETDGVRFHAAFAPLGEYLKARGTQFLGLTASRLRGQTRDFLVKQLGCREHQPYHRSIVHWLPRVEIKPIPCLDPAVTAADRDISRRNGNLLRRLIKEVGEDVFDEQEEHYWNLMKAIAGGAYGETAANLAKAILQNERERIDLFEDKGTKGTKLLKAVQIADLHRSSIVYCREIALADRLVAAKWNRNPPPLEAHSELGDKYLSVIDKFISSTRQVLVMTRDLGKRGLDFPMAASLILYSPKSSPLVMDQELCRTRGQRWRSKPVYVLFYSDTYDELKMCRVLLSLVGMKMFGRFQKYDLARRWRTWLDKHPSLGLFSYLLRLEGPGGALPGAVGKTTRCLLRRRALHKSKLH